MKFISGSQYLGAYLGLRDQLEAWVKAQVEAWANRVRALGNSLTAPTVGLHRLGNVVATQVAVPAKDCHRSWDSNRSYWAGPKREILPCDIRGGGYQRRLSANPRP